LFLQHEHPPFAVDCALLDQGGSEHRRGIGEGMTLAFVERAALEQGAAADR
jgi:hypothetical protein